MLRCKKNSYTIVQQIMLFTINSGIFLNLPKISQNSRWKVEDEHQNGLIDSPERKCYRAGVKGK